MAHLDPSILAWADKLVQPNVSSQVQTAVLPCVLLWDVLEREENMHVLRKHYAFLTKGNKDDLPLELTGLPLPTAEEVGEIDVGQDLFLANNKF